jgi:acyl carrier protein
LGILRLVGFIEEEFNILIADEDVVLENFQSITALNDFLNTK